MYQVEMRKNLLKILSEFGIGILVGYFRTSDHILTLRIKFLVENSCSSGESSPDISRYRIPYIEFIFGDTFRIQLYTSTNVTTSLPN